MSVVRERLGRAVEDVHFDRDVVRVQVLSVQHERVLLETTIGPLTKLVKELKASDPQKLEAFRRELEALGADYFEENHLLKHYLLSRAIKL